MAKGEVRGTIKWQTGELLVLGIRKVGSETISRNWCFNLTPKDKEDLFGNEKVRGTQLQMVRIACPHNPTMKDYMLNYIAGEVGEEESDLFKAHCLTGHLIRTIGRIPNLFRARRTILFLRKTLFPHQKSSWVNHSYSPSGTSTKHKLHWYNRYQFIICLTAFRMRTKEP